MKPYKYVENPMVVDSHWDDLESVPKQLGECLGCEDDILPDEEVYIVDNGMVHNKERCCKDYIHNISILKVVGE